MKTKIYIAIILTSTLSSCHIYRTYERPASIVVSDSLYRQSIVTEDTASLASLSWKELFTDPQLQQLIETGLTHNTDLSIARLKVKEAEALLMSSRLSYLPSVSFTPQGTLTSADGNKPSKTYNLAVSADWEIDLFGKLLNAKRGAQAALEQSEAYRQAVQTQLVATIANTYYSLLMLDRQLDISKKTAQTWAEYLRTMKALKKAGQATEMAVAQAEASKLSIDASVLSIKRQINETENTLSTLLGMSPQEIGRSNLEVQQFPDSLSTGIPLQLLSRRPDVRQCEQQLAVAYYATNSARSAFYPSITLNGSAGWTNAAGATIINPGQWLWDLWYNLFSIAAKILPI